MLFFAALVCGFGVCGFGIVWPADLWAAKGPVESYPLKIRNGKMVCPPGVPPVININPVSNPIQYDFSKKSADLTAAMRRENNYNPYAGMADTATGGMRHDEVVTSLSIEWQIFESPDLGQACMQYKSVSVTVTLSPVVYVAQEFSKPPCRDAVIEHELKHIEVDRRIMNAYVQAVGTLVKRAVDQTGVIGPVSIAAVEDYKTTTLEQVKQAMRDRKAALEQDQYNLQAEVDSRAEYDRISAICKGPVRLER
ncbi:hypothetical protein MICA_1819 [Micavibrio aeruginosavorus ARL-13]|uniref:DUF922 domain-containing protein n=1 Tax=Micavibrio aeruginosavorus (strain ARL-13) TaxID=856793 RepID=G2KSY5_MICAA|nr:hypothetical protein MICA_1819 [Micavibrio aeruginosavorus ARL-13]